MNSSDAVTVVFGFSDNPDRYAYKAFHLLKEYQHHALAFNPRTEDISSLPKEFHTLTLYVNSEVLKKFQSELLKSNFKRVIFNPGTESSDFENECIKRKIEIVHGCTLVMLKTDQF